jgi:heme exporter protein CcmD
MAEYFHMSGYAAYVWSAYALGVGGVVLNIILARRSLRMARAEARRRIEMEKLP